MSRRRFRTVVLSCLASVTALAMVPALAAPGFQAGAAGVGDPYFPRDGNGGYDVAHYALAIDYNPASNRLVGTARIRAKATQGLSRFNLDFDGLRVRSVKVNGRAASWVRTNGELVVTPRHGIHKRATFHTEVRYDGVPITLQDFFGGGANHTDDGVMILGQPHSASTWYPVNDHPTDNATYRIALTVPNGVEAISNGALVSKQARRGRTTWTWHAHEPMAGYLTTAAIGQFDVDAYRKDGIRYWDAVDPDLFDHAGAKTRTGLQYAWSQQTSDGASYKHLSRTITVPAAGATLSFWVDRDTEAEWDFMFVEAHPVGSSNWTTLRDLNGHTTRDTGIICPFWPELHPFLRHYTTVDDEFDCRPTGTTGAWWAVSGASNGYERWTVDLAPYANRQVEMAISYAGDETIQGAGLFVDDVVVSTGEGSTSFEDDGDTMDGWRVPGPPAGSPPNENDWVATPEVELPTIGAAVQASLDRQPEIIDFLSSKFGPYPFSTSGGIVDDGDMGFALETQTRPVYSPLFWEFGLGDSVVVHELAHQWYGDHVAVERWSDIWLNEGFASYAEWLWSERDGLGTADQIFRTYYTEFYPAGDAFWTLTIGDPGPGSLFDFPVYDRGAMTMHVLRREVGDHAFFRILRAWAAGNGNGSTPEFIALAERLSGEQLDALFDAWLFMGSRPRLTAAMSSLRSQPSLRTDGLSSAVRRALPEAKLPRR